MNKEYHQLARLLRVSPELVFSIDKSLSGLTGQAGVIKAITEENKVLIDRVLSDLKLDRGSAAWEVYKALIRRLTALDEELHELLGRPDLNELASVCGRLCEMAFQLAEPAKGFFIKKEKAVELLEKRKPYNLLNHFGYGSVKELVDKEGFASVVSALRFSQSIEWMHSFFAESYANLGPGDFEEREVQLLVLEEKWLEVARRFLEKKYHNVSHLKEFGIIFIVPLKLDSPGEILRIFILLLHYLNEVPFYSKLFRKFSQEPGFAEKLKSLLRGDVLSTQDALPFALHVSRPTWLIIQRYLAKEDRHDLRLFLPHINPEAEHWFKAQESLSKLGPAFQLWQGLDFAGDYFPSTGSINSLQADSGQAELVSFDLVDLVMTLVKRGEVKYLFHQQEALWNKIFIEYFGRDKMNELIEKNIIQGYIEL